MDDSLVTPEGFSNLFNGLSSGDILEALLKGTEKYEAPLPGEYYDTYVMPLETSKGSQMVIVKKLKPTDQLPVTETFRNERDRLFAGHQSEHKEFTSTFEGTGMILPTIFIADPDSDSYYTIQPFVDDYIAQYKMWLKKSLPIPHIEDATLRDEMATAARILSDGIDILLEKKRIWLMDLDFFVVNYPPFVVIFDTSYFWPEKREGKDRAQLVYDLARYLRQLTAE